jgi:hypothetical protein
MRLTPKCCAQSVRLGERRRQVWSAYLSKRLLAISPVGKQLAAAAPRAKQASVEP